MTTATKPPSLLVLDAVDCKARKISNNLLNFGPEKVTAFTIPLEEIPLRGQVAIDQLLGKGSFRSLFDQDETTGHWTPATWWHVIDGGVMKLGMAIEVDDVELIVGPHTLVLEHDQDSEGNDRAIGKITEIVLKAVGGGVCVMSLHLTVRPGRGRENLILQDSQYEAITVTLGDTRLITKPGAKQQQLDLKPPADPPAQVMNGSHLAGVVAALAENAAAAADRQPEGLTNVEHASGDVRTLAEQELGADVIEPCYPPGDPRRYRETGPTAAELEQFEANARKQLEAATARPGHVTDGTTERSRRGRSPNAH